MSYTTIRKTVSNRELLQLLKEAAKRYRCLKCSYRCSAGETLSRHKRNKHPRFICGACGQKYLQAKRFKDHLTDYEECGDFVNQRGVVDREMVPPQTINTQQLGRSLTKINLFFLVYEQ